MASIFAEDRMLQDWLDVEAAIGYGLAAAGVVDAGIAERIVKACRMEAIDRPRLWSETAVVGYPIFPLVRMICDVLDDEAAGFVHFGATTQDIMDTALALQLRDATHRLVELCDAFGDAVAVLVEEHMNTVMAARTHAQQAVPTTFGAKCATFLDELARHRTRLVDAGRAAAVVSLFGAGGTSAALAERAPTVRREVADRLGLGVTVVPWHVARDRPLQLVTASAMAAAACVRFAREIIDLARTEVGEVAESDGMYRGASSTMPQKANPIASEMAVGFGVMAEAAASAMFRAAEAGHERSAGEWQVEWQAIPQACTAAAGALRAAAMAAKGLRVYPDRMEANLALDGGRIMAEAYMITLSGELGRDTAHEALYQAVRRSRESDVPLLDALAASLPRDVWATVEPRLPRPAQYLGETRVICRAALQAWRAARDVTHPSQTEHVPAEGAQR